MTKEECIALMESSKSKDEWNQNYKQVKRAHGRFMPNIFC